MWVAAKDICPIEMRAAMKRFAAGLTCILLLAAATSLYAFQQVPTIEEIMEKTHKIKKGLRDQIMEEAMKPKPDFAKMQNAAAEFTKQISQLERNVPPKGPLAGWIKLSKDYLKDAMTLEDAVKSKDTKAVLAALKAQGKKCDACHDMFRP
jgi:cytochrome c556